jgi:hypothetical protein
VLLGNWLVDAAGDVASELRRRVDLAGGPRHLSNARICSGGT